MLIDGMDLHDSRHERDSGGDPVFFEVLTGVARKGPSSGFRFNRLMEDVNAVSSYLHDIRLCFIALTILIYCITIGFLIQKCIQRRRKAEAGTRSWKYQNDANPTTLECRNQSTQLEDLVSVRSDGQLGNLNNVNSNPNAGNNSNPYLRNHRSSTPSMMRPGRHQYATGHEIGNGGKLPEKAKLIPSSTDTDHSHLKHQIPHIIANDLPQSYSDHSPSATIVSNTSNEDKSVTSAIATRSSALHQRPPLPRTRADSTEMM